MRNDLYLKRIDFAKADIEWLGHGCPKIELCPDALNEFSPAFKELVNLYLADQTDSISIPVDAAADEATNLMKSIYDMYREVVVVTLATIETILNQIPHAVERGETMSAVSVVADLMIATRQKQNPEIINPVLEALKDAIIRKGSQESIAKLLGTARKQKKLAEKPLNKIKLMANMLSGELDEIRVD